jgi:hypothetical protein
MKHNAKTLLIAVAATALFLLPQNTLAQGRGGRGGFDPAQMRQRMIERIQTQLGASDEEWQVIQPLLEDVMSKQRAATGARYGGIMMLFRPRGDAGGGSSRRFGRGAPDPTVEALQKALENKDTPPAEIKAKLKALRESRAKAEAALKASREKLRAVLTLRQEAELVMLGVLD